MTYTMSLSRITALAIVLLAAGDVSARTLGTTLKLPAIVAVQI